MRRRIIATVLAGVTLCPGSWTMSHAQVLDLGRAKSIPVPGTSVLDEISLRMRSGLRPERNASPVVLAGNQLRRIVIELASGNREDDEVSNLTALAAIRLSAAVGGLERRLETLSRDGAFVGTPPRRLTDAEREQALDRLETFHRIALEELRRRPRSTVPEFDETMSKVLAPVRDAIEIVELAELRNHWPLVTAVTAGGGVSFKTVDLPMPTHPGFEAADRAWNELSLDVSRVRRPQLRGIGTRILALRDRDDARRLHELLVEELDDLLRLVAADPRSARFSPSIASLEAGVVIAEDLERLRSTPGTRKSDIERLQSAAILAFGLEDETSRRRLLRRQASILQLVVEAGSFDPASVDRQLRATARQIELRHRRVVKTAIDDLERLGSDPDAISDPAVIGGLKALEASGRDLRRLRAADDLALRLTSVRPGAAKEFGIQLRRWARMLADDAARPEASRALARIEEDLDRFAPLPGEVDLATADKRMETLLAGRAADLLSRITETRRMWADEISNGEVDGPSRGELADLARLCELLVDLRSISRDEERISRGIETCNRWGGWYVSSASLGWASRTLLPGLALAADAAAEGDFDRLRRDLRRLERQTPPARLVAWLASNLEGPVDRLRDGSVGALAAIVSPPGPEAWGLEHRDSVARICRAFAELAAARRRDDPDAVRELSSWLIEACDDLLGHVSSFRIAPAARGPIDKEA